MCGRGLKGHSFSCAQPSEKPGFQAVLKGRTFRCAVRVLIFYPSSRTLVREGDRLLSHSDVTHALSPRARTTSNNSRGRGTIVSETLAPLEDDTGAYDSVLYV